MLSSSICGTSSTDPWPQAAASVALTAFGDRRGCCASRGLNGSNFITLTSRTEVVASSLVVVRQEATPHHSTALERLAPLLDVHLAPDTNTSPHKPIDNQVLRPPCSLMDHQVETPLAASIDCTSMLTSSSSWRSATMSERGRAQHDSEYPCCCVTCSPQTADSQPARPRHNIKIKITRLPSLTLICLRSPSAASILVLPSRT